ncbi:MAG: PQQ-dependent sugar dehydrogenase [Nitrososphaeraceae archaeon]|nr:PQQ-dependent sugar dehydrogenase [Nitrososphaeraceae archaeon]
MINKSSIIYLILSVIMVNVLINFDGIFVSNVSGQSSEEKSEDSVIINDPKLKTELIVSGLEFPTSMAFIDKDDFLILEKETGLVKRVTDGKILDPLLQLDVSGKDERGLLGIDIFKKEYPAGFDVIYVYLSYVECESKEFCENKVVRYELDSENNKLIYPKELFSVESFPDDSHIGGVLKVGLDDNVYVTVGDFHGTEFKPIYETQAQNFENGVSADGRAGILRISPDGDPIDNGILGKEYPLNLYFAYGIRNSFGIGFDPLTGYLWDTENGPDYGDEINLVEPGFNSGSLKIFGEFNSNSNYQFHNIGQSNTERGPDGLVTFNGNGKYSEPELSWQNTVAPTSVTFLDSNKLGNNYQYDMFVANAGGGKIYHFDLSHDRKHLELKNSLADKVVDSEIEEDSITFAEGFGLITDLEMNPYDGYLYVVAPIKGDSSGGSVYKIVPKSPDTILFPSGVESTQGNGQLVQENNNFVICDKLSSFDKALMNEWEEGRITDDQAVLLGEQAKILMTESRCFN